MNAFEKIIAFLSKDMQTPAFYGLYHIVSIVFVLSACAAVIILRKKITTKQIAYLTLTVGLIMTVLEIYKQLVLCYNPTNDVWSYRWFAFPFQFCSTPTYVSLLAFLFYKLNVKTVYNAMLGFLSTYGLVAGIMVIFVGTKGVLCTSVGINLQTMIHHGLMMVLGVAILASRAVPFNKKTFVASTLVFFPLLAVAMILNAIIPKLDLFYVSTTSTKAFKPISDFFFGGNLPYIIYLIGYIVLFAGASALVLFIANKITKKSA